MKMCVAGRRLPVYLVLDCSESMAGEPWDAMRSGFEQMLKELRDDPMALETAAIGIITFASRAKQHAPLTDLIRFIPPQLKMGSGTALGAALRLLDQSLKTEVRKTTADQKGDYKPLVFILTDGEPTDKWEDICTRFHNEIAGKSANVIAIGCGPDVDLNKLRRITPTVIELKTTDETSFARFFKWVSASVTTASVAFERGGEQGVAMPGLPQECMSIAKPGETRQSFDVDRYVFLHVKCSRSGQFYVLRYKKSSEKLGLLGGGRTTYVGAASHKVDDFDFDSEETGTAANVNVSMLGEPTPCPYCQNDGWAHCECGHIQCSPAFTGKPITLKCPWCSIIGTYAPGDFSVGRGGG